MTRLLRILPGLALVAATIIVVWAGGGWVPPGMLLAHGPAYSPRPTGRVHTDRFGLTFVEITGGAFRIGSHGACERGDLAGRVAGPLWLDLGEPPRHVPRPCGQCPREWVEVPRPYWIARREYGVREIRALTGVELDRAGAEEFRSFLAALGEGGDRYRLPSEVEWEAAALAGESVGDGPLRRTVSTRSFFAGHLWGVPGPGPADPPPPGSSSDADPPGPDSRFDPEVPNRWGLRGMEARPDELTEPGLPRLAYVVWDAASHPNIRVEGPRRPDAETLVVRGAALGRSRGGRAVVSRYLLWVRRPPVYGLAVRPVWIPPEGLR